VKPRARAAATTFSREAAETRSGLPNVYDAVIVETPASSATCASVGRREAWLFTDDSLGAGGSIV
jgi:hypothetical protein